MVSLRQFQNGVFKVERSEDIFYQRFEDFFQRLHNGKNIVNFTCGREDTRLELENLLEKMKTIDGKKLILSVNGDTDIPCIKKEYLLQDSIPYTEEKQRQGPCSLQQVTLGSWSMMIAGLCQQYWGLGGIRV